MIYLKCPLCGATLSVPEEYKNDKQLHCSQCQQNFDNTPALYQQVQFKKIKKRKKGGQTLQDSSINKKSGGGSCCIWIIVLIVGGIISMFMDTTESIKIDGKTVYVITKDLYMPKSEKTAKDYTDAMYENRNDEFGRTVYQLDHLDDMTLLHQGDEVVVIKGSFLHGYTVRKLSTYETAIVPNKDYLRKK